MPLDALASAHRTQRTQRTRAERRERAERRVQRSDAFEHTRGTSGTVVTGTPNTSSVDVRAWVERPYTPKRVTRRELDPAAFAHNFAIVRDAVGPNVAVCAVLKANAYGHGAVECARLALANGASQLAVATVEEGVELRKAGIDAPVLVLGAHAPEEADDIVGFALTATVFSREGARDLADAAARQGVTAKVHVKVNTGMNRLGVRPDDAPALVRELHTMRQLDVEGIFTHFHSADSDPHATRAQLAKFTRVLDELERAGLRPKIAHAANSDATLAFPEAHLDMVRPGTALHGFVAGGVPSLQWKTGVVHVNHLEPGETVSYGATWTAPAKRTVAVLPVGWADGLAAGKEKWREVLVNGVRCPVVGSICMDQCMVDVTHAGDVKVGSEVVLLGAQGGDRITAEQATQWLAAGHPVEITTRISRRCPVVTSATPDAREVPFTARRDDRRARRHRHVAVVTSDA